MEIMIKTVFQQIITQCTGTQDIIKKLASCDPFGGKRGLKTVAFLLHLSIFVCLLFSLRLVIHRAVLKCFNYVQVRVHLPVGL